MSLRLDLVQWRFKEGGFTYEGIANDAGLSLSTVWKFIKGISDPSASTIIKLFEAMGLDPKHAFNFNLKKSQFRRAVVATAR